MKLFSLVLFTALALADDKERTDLSREEKLELAGRIADASGLFKAAVEAQAKIQAFADAYQARLKQLATKHNAEGCELDATWLWVCKPTETPKTVKK